LKKRYRVKRSDEIKALLDARRVKKNAFFSVYIRPNDYPHFRYAISVPRRYGKAVKRNRVKRQIRMIVSEAGINSEVDVFIIVHPKAGTLEFKNLKKKLLELFKKHKIVEV